MANRFTNLLGNTKTRTMVLLVLGVLIVGVAIAVSQTGDTKPENAPDRISRTTEVPNQVKSTPGEQVTRKYQELQEKANIRGAEEAAKEGKTFIPTLTGNAEGFSDADFEKQLNAAFDDMGGKCSKATIENLRKEGMNTNQIIMRLKCYGCKPNAISALFTCDEIAAALADAGKCTIQGCSEADAKMLQDMGLDATKIAAAFADNKCSPSDTAKALKANSVSANDIAAALKANGSSIDEIAKALRESGSSAEEVALALKAAGADVTQIATAMSKAGFSKAEILPALSKAGFSSLEVAKAMQAIDLLGGDAATLLAQQKAREAEARRLAGQQEAQGLANFSQQKQARIQELVVAMEGQRKTAMDAWTKVSEQTMVQGQWATDKAKARQEAGLPSASGSSTSAAPAIILKAGTILFGVLDTAVNSDEPGPVMATIVSGALKGSRLMGTMKTNTDAEKITLTFTAINMPNESKSMGITAVAIDPDTARTALASDVDHHYLLRWGSLFASSFIEGYASAVANAGTTSTTSQGAAGTVTTTSSPGLDGRQQLFSGLAAIGSKWSEVVARNFDRPITVTIDQGTGIGVLITSDLTYGTEPVFYDAKNPTPFATGQAAAATPGGTGQGGQATSPIVGGPAAAQIVSPPGVGNSFSVSASTPSITTAYSSTLPGVTTTTTSSPTGTTTSSIPGG